MGLGFRVWGGGVGGVDLKTKFGTPNCLYQECT